MKCNRIQELLLTDYTDQELDPGLRGEVAKHLHTCAACSKFEQDLRLVRLPLQNAGHQEAPVEVWQNIRAEIEEERAMQQAGFPETLLDRLMRLLRNPRPVFVATASLAVLIAALVLGRMAFQAYPLNQMDAAEATFIYGGLEGDEEIAANLGTAVEQYFL